MKLLKIGSLGILVLFLLALAWLWTPSTSRQAMQLKYGDANSQFLSLDDGSVIHYRDQGNPQGAVLLMIHGTSASLHTWQPLIELLSPDYRMVSLDLPAHGLTGANPSRDYSHQALVNSVWQLMDHLRLEKLSLVGNSLGGAVVWKAALDAPNRVKSLIMLAPSGAPRTTLADSNLGFKILATSIGRAAMLHITPRIIIQASLKQTIEDDQLVNDAMVDRYWELLRMDGNRQAMVDLAQTSRATDAWKELHKITQPALIIWGEQDGLLPIDMLDTFIAQMPNETVVRLPNVGHLPMEEAVTQTAAEIRHFCSQVDC